MERLASAIDAVNRAIGSVLSWAALILALWQFGLILAQAVFRVGSIFAQEALIYMNALLFLGAGGYTLLKDGHVRVDLFYHQMTDKTKAWVNLLGTALFLWPMCLLILISGTPYVVDSWVRLEGSIETSGIPAVFVLKTFILVFALLVSLQGLSLVLRSLMTIKAQRHDG
ncbi:MAG: TRAP transporter small permease subunit [Pseudomonadota bacterium]